MMIRCEVAPLTRCLLARPEAVWVDERAVDEQWSALGFADRPDFETAVREHAALARCLEDRGVESAYLPPGPGLTLDAIYVRDASVVGPRGAILCRMGKETRWAEPHVQRVVFQRLGIPVIGEIEGDGRLEGGDVVWLDGRTVAAGIGYRTNPEGIRQLRELLGPDVDVLPVHLPHWRGPGDVFHLMSILSPIGEDLALVYSPLMPVTFRDELVKRGFRLVEVPDEELEMGPNALAIAPGVCLLESANVETCRRLEAAGVEVVVYEGREISRKGRGGPTCLTRPLARRE